jgi:drug/metabolite transporter (DMT)-like permease
MTNPGGRAPGSREWPEEPDGDLTDLLSEIRVLLPGAHTLTAFLIILPFNDRFGEIQDLEKGIYLVTFLCSVLSLVCFTAPAAHHRLQRPLRDREAFKNMATRMIIAGLVPLSLALVLASQLVLSTVMDPQWVSWLVAAALAAVIGSLWWLLPLGRRNATTGAPGSGNPHA